MWGNCGLALKNKLQSLPNRAAHVVTWTKFGCVEPDQLLKNLRWLNVQQLIDFDTAVMVHKSINNKAPPYWTSLFSKSNSVHNYDTRTANLNLLPTHARLKFGQKCFSHYECHLWNKLVLVPIFGGLSGSEDKGGGDNSTQFINIGRVGDKSFKEWRRKIGGWKGGWQQYFDFFMPLARQKSHFKKLHFGQFFLFVVAKFFNS